MLKLGEDSLTREMGALSKLGRDQDQRCKDPGTREPEDILTKSSMCCTGYPAPGLPVLESVGTTGHSRRTECSGPGAPGRTVPAHTRLFWRRGGPMCSKATSEAVWRCAGVSRALPRCWAGQHREELEFEVSVRAWDTEQDPGSTQASANDSQMSYFQPRPHFLV